MSAPVGAGGPSTVLIAEDHLDSREALSALLDAFGYHVVAAVNGREVLRLAREIGPDIILMDLMMPEVDGFEATRALRKDPSTRHTPIITLTAMDGARELALQAGADDFLAKPIDSAHLRQKLQAFLE
jgi:CheY-like chemotaxis protein